MLLLAMLNELKCFRWHFLMFANNWIYWKVELLQHVNMEHNNKFHWYVKSFHLTIYHHVFVLYFQTTIFLNLWTPFQNNYQGKWKMCSIYTMFEMPCPCPGLELRSTRRRSNSPTPTRRRIKSSRDVGELVLNPIQLIRS